MEARELRIGNIVASKQWRQSAPIEGIEIVKDGFELKIKGYVHTCVPDRYFDIEPIPITVEWLEIFGFKKSDGGYYEYAKMKFDFNNLGLLRFHWNRKVSYLKYVHQLQNLCFWISGEELTLTNDNP